ncbi:MAG: ATP-binding cassette domain-containing protein [Bryobacteraceae bacterium]
MADIVIRTVELTRHFGALRAVDRLSIEVPAGAIYGFLGPNGSGKTTTIRMLLGLLEPTAGRAEVLGYDTRTQAGEIRLRAGALLEHHGLYERFSAWDNLDFYGRIWRMPRRERHKRIEELLRRLGLWDRRQETIGRWSRGMKQKLAVARALLHRPRVVFLDEPTAGLDPVAAASLREDLAAMARHEGVTVFLTTHNLAEAEKLCSLVAVISAGRLLATGHPDELRDRAGIRAEIAARGVNESVLAALRSRPEVAGAQFRDARLTVELHPGAELAPLISLLVGSGVQIEEVRKASLEDVFLTLIEEEKRCSPTS